MDNNNAKPKRSVFDSLTFSGIGSSRRIVKNAISKSFGALTEKFVCTSSRTYGVMSLAFGLLSLFVYFGKFYLIETPELPLYEIFVGAAFVLLSIPLSIFDKPLCQLLQDFLPTDYILFDFFSIKRMDRKENAKGISAFSAILIGFIPALLTVFVPTVYVLLGIASILFISISFVTPEFTVIFTVLIAPYLSPIPDNGLTLALLAALSTVSYFTKLIIGKRFFKIEIYDIILVLFTISLAVSGIINGSLSFAFNMIALTLGYLLASNLVLNRRLADCVVNALVVSSVPIGIFALVKYIADFAGGAPNVDNSVIFSSTDSFGAYLLLAGIFSFCYANDTREKRKGSAYFLVFVLNFVNMILAWQPELWLALILSLPAYLIIKRPRIRKEFLILLLAIPYLLFLLPSAFSDAASDFLSLSPSFKELLQSIKSGYGIFRENIFDGVGYNELYISNTFVSFAVSFGVFSSSILVLLFLIRLSHYSEFYAYTRQSPMSSPSEAGMLAGFALFALGSASDIFSDITLFYIFVSVFGLVSASLRIAKNEHDERIGYYGTVRSDDASDVNVRISV